MPTDPWGFTKVSRVDTPKRPVPLRLQDWDPVYARPDPTDVQQQARRCMSCGVPFCHHGCPLGNLIPEWNELVLDGDWARAVDRLHATNNFPEFTGWLCPAPCEPACVLAINDAPVAIKQIELSIIERAYDDGRVVAQPPDRLTMCTVAVVGSGPAGLAVAQQLTRAGHTVVVYEKSDAIGGLLRYGIPDFKMPKTAIDRRVAQMEAEGTRFVTGVEVGSAHLPIDRLRQQFDAVVLCVGSLAPRDVELSGRELAGVVQAMDYLPEANRHVAGLNPTVPVSAAGKHVVILGGGDTAADCLGTANRQGAASVTVLDHNPVPPSTRDSADNPWPQWARTHKKSPAHEEGVTESWATQTLGFVADGTGEAVAAVRVREVVRAFDDTGRRVFHPVEGSDREIPADLVLLAVGFVGTGADELLSGLAVEVAGDRGTVRVDEGWATSTSQVFSCGDATRGASLVVWAIAEGRACAAAVDRALQGSTRLPAPVGPHDRSL